MKESNSLVPGVLSIPASSIPGLIQSGLPIPLYQAGKSSAGSTSLLINNALLLAGYYLNILKHRL